MCIEDFMKPCGIFLLFDLPGELITIIVSCGKPGPNATCKRTQSEQLLQKLPVGKNRPSYYSKRLQWNAYSVYKLIGEETSNSIYKRN